MSKRCLTLILLLIGAGSSFGAGSAQKLYDEAVIKETGERDPEAALALYRQAIASAGANDPLVPKAQLQMGACLERLGKPQEAQAAYQQIINNSAAPADTVQGAQANLERIQAQQKKAQDEAARNKSMVLAREFHETRFSLLAGPALSVSGSHSLGNFSLAMRYRLSPVDRAYALSGEVGGFIPFGNTTLEDGTKSFNGAVDHAALKLNSQIHLALVAELPHGLQKKTIPELGIGAAVTSSAADYTSTSSAGTQSNSSWSPYITTGLRLWADRRASLLLSANYTANPYTKSVQIASPAHTQTFDFPNSLWSFNAQVMIKIGSIKTVMRPKE